MLTKADNASHRLGHVEIQREVYENGAVLLSNQVRESETIAISGTIKAGAICDQPGKFGTAELASRLLSRGTRSMSGAQISQKIEEAGATLSFDNRDESVGFTSRCYTGVLGEVLAILGECLMHPTFPENEIALAKNEIIAEIKAEEDDTRSMASRRLAEMVFGRNAPYGRDTLGRPDELKEISAAELADFHEENYSPSKLIIAITGGYDFDALRTEIERVFSNWGKKGSGKLPYYAETEIRPGNTIISMKHKTQVDLAFGTRSVPRSSHDYYPLNLGNLILGRLGLYGRLGKNVREERGLAYYSFSTLQSKLFSGLFAVFAGVNPSNLIEAREAILDEVRKIATEPISPQELETAKRNSLGALSISLDTSIERVAILHDIEYHNLGLDYLERIPSILEHVSSEEILTSFQKYVDVDQLSSVMAGPVSEEILQKLPSSASSI